MKRRGQGYAKKILLRILLYAVVIFFCLYILVPFADLFIISFSKQGSLPTHLLDIHAENFTGRYWVEVIEKDKLWNPIFNSIKVAATVVFVVLLVSLPASYTFSRWRSSLRRRLMYVLLLFRMIPSIALVIPLFIIMARLRLMDTTLAIAIAVIPMSIPYAIWLLKGYIDSVPIELEESAWIEGASISRTMFTIVFPNCVPGIMVTGVYTFLGGYINYIFAVVIARNRAITLPVQIASYFAPHTIYYQNLAVATLLGAIPMLILFVIIRRSLTKGLAITAGFK
jgi:multiple sugar transport system permease protein